MWLLEPSVKQKIESAEKAGLLPTAEQQAHFETLHESGGESGSRIMSIAGNNAEIEIKGVLTKSPNFMAMLFGDGSTTYSEIISALAEAGANPAVENVELAIDSPGGSFDGLFDVLGIMESFNKPIKSVISNVCASAAFAIASQANTVVATNRAARIGSIGVAATFNVFDNKITITSTEAPKKLPDVTTAEGVAMVREELDAMHSIFVDSIAKGRGTTAETVNKEFGQGATLLAGEALQRGMIDSIADTPLKIVSNSQSKISTQHPEKCMDLTTLKNTHPNVYAEAVNVGVEKGRMQERKNAVAHLTMGKASGDMKTAFEAITAGTEMDVDIQSRYMAAGMNRKDISSRFNDDDDLGDLNTQGDDKEKVAAADIAILASAAEYCGVELEA